MPDRAWRSGPLHPALVLLPYPQPGRAPARQTPGSRDSTHRKERVTSRSVSRGQSPAAPEVCVGTARPALGISRPPQRAPTPPPQFRSVPGCSWPRGMPQAPLSARTAQSAFPCLLWPERRPGWGTPRPRLWNARPSLPGRCREHRPRAGPRDRACPLRGGCPARTPSWHRAPGTGWSLGRAGPPDNGYVTQSPRGAGA